MSRSIVTSSCAPEPWRKSDEAENIEPTLEVTGDGDTIKENDAPELSSDKKTDEVVEPEKPRSIFWRVGSGLYNTTTGVVGGTVGAGVSGVKWVAGKGYGATTATAGAVVSGTKAVVSKVPIPTWKNKDKKE